jgi:hypothetical protein
VRRLSTGRRTTQVAICVRNNQPRDAILRDLRICTDSVCSYSGCDDWTTGRLADWVWRITTLTMSTYVHHHLFAIPFAKIKQKNFIDSLQLQQRESDAVRTGRVSDGCTSRHGVVTDMYLHKIHSRSERRKTLAMASPPSVHRGANCREARTREGTAWGRRVGGEGRERGLDTCIGLGDGKTLRVRTGSNFVGSTW